MSLTVMNFNLVRDLTSNLGWKDNDSYVVGYDCLNALENLEDELLKEDVTNRNIRLGLQVCDVVRKDLIPILIHGQDAKILAVATRVLVSLSLPVECLLPIEDALLTPRTRNVRRQLLLFSLVIKKSFLDVAATLSLVTMLRETMIKAEKHQVPLKEEEQNHLKNCLILLRNLLHIPEDPDLEDKNSSSIEWQSVQNKLIWNLFVQGIDGALLLMLNSRYRSSWTIPLSLIVALLYKNQNVNKVHKALELISSASESSGDEEESDGSKNSSASLSSETSKIAIGVRDSGCPLTSDASTYSYNEQRNSTNNIKREVPKNDFNSCNIHTKLEKVQISDDDPVSSVGRNKYSGSMNICESKMKHPVYSKSHSIYPENDSESSSCSESPHHKKIRGSASTNEDICMSEATDASIKEDSAISESMDRCSNDVQGKSSDDEMFGDKKSGKNFKVFHKLRCLQMHSNVMESDSSNEDLQDVKKYRSHPPAGRRGKSPKRNSDCTPSVCLDSAIAVSCSKGRMKYPLWEKRNSVSILVDLNSNTPSDDDIGNLLKEFTLSFLHSGFSSLILDLKKLLLQGPSVSVDKSLLFWMLSYFLHLAASVHLSLDHISDVLSADVISYLVYECVLACENIELHPKADKRFLKYITVHLNLLVTALKEVMSMIDLYSRRPTSQKEKTYFSDICGKLAELRDLRDIPLLLFNSSAKNNSKYLEDVVILNHYILITLEKGSLTCWEPKRIDIMSHLKQFANRNVINCYGKLLENFKLNSHFLNECLFTMLHHVAGDIHSSELLLEPSILKTFSSFLKEDVDLEQYQEDLVMYILNKFSVKVQKTSQKKDKAEKTDEGESSDDSSSNNSSVSSNCLLSEEDDDLFWWYLQFEQDKDPISRISEHISTSKRDILSKLQLRGIISHEKFKALEVKVKTSTEVASGAFPNEDIMPIANFDDDITHLLRTLVQCGERQHLIWLQDVLLETCYIKLVLITHLAEPVPFYSMKMMTSVPLVPYTEEQRSILQDKIFLQLLQKLGFHLGTGVCQMYPRIPLFWTADVIFTIAARLGPIRKDKLKFSYEELLLADPNHDPVTLNTTPSPTLPPLSSCGTLSSWLTAVQQSKEHYRSLNLGKTSM